MSDEKIVYVLSVDLPNLPKGERIQIAGLGTFENGGSYDINERMAENFRAYNGRQTPIFDEDDGSLIGTEWVKGPTVLEASKQMYGVEVSTAGSGGQQSNSGNQSNSGGNQPPPPPPGDDKKTEGGDN